MKYIEDKAGNGFMIYTHDEVIPPGTELLQFATAEAAGALVDRMLATPEGQARLQQILLEAHAAGEPLKPNT